MVFREWCLPTSDLQGHHVKITITKNMNHHIVPFSPWYNNTDINNGISQYFWKLLIQCIYRIHSQTRNQEIYEIVVDFEKWFYSFGPGSGKLAKTLEILLL